MKEEILKQQTNYHKPTPKKWRKIGDAIMGLGTIITGVAAHFANPWIVVAAAALTYVGKTITNFATE